MSYHSPKNKEEEDVSLINLTPPDDTTLKASSIRTIKELALESPPKPAETTASGLQDEIGIISGEYACRLNKIEGTLYAGSEGVVFDGNIFFYKHHLCIPWQNVTTVQPSQNTNILQFHCVNQNYSVYSFYLINSKDDEQQQQSSDRVWTTLAALHNEHAAGIPRREAHLTGVRASLRRLSQQTCADDLHASLSAASLAMDTTEEAYITAATAANMEDIRAQTMSDSTSRRRLSFLPSNTRKLKEEVVDPKVAWEDFYRNRADTYAECAFEPEDISCTDLDTFYNLFLQNDAPHSIASFMEQAMGDVNLVTSRWTSQEERTIDYSHPVSAPLAPPLAKARKEQRHIRYGDYGLCLETDTYVEDVPMADCFYVTDRLVVAVDHDGKLQMSTYFDIRFVKSTMFRAIISNTTRSEFLKSFMELLKYVRIKSSSISSLGQQDGGEEQNATAETGPASTIITAAASAKQQQQQQLLSSSTSSTSRAQQFLFVVITLVLLCQICLIFEIRTMQQTLFDALYQKSINADIHRCITLLSDNNNYSNTSVVHDDGGEL